MSSKKQTVSESYHSAAFRIGLVSVLVGLTFVPIDQLFFLVFLLNIPHAILSSYRRYQTPEITKKPYLVSEVFTLLVAIGLGLYSKQLLFYLAFIRFGFHFFEDDFYNLGLKKKILSLLVLILFMLDDFQGISVGFKLTLALVGLIYFSFKTRNQGPIRFLSFYFVYLTLMFLGPMTHKTFNSSTWGYNLGIMHALMWLTWEGFGRSGTTLPSFSFKSFFSSMGFLSTLLFGIASWVYLTTLEGGFQQFMSQGQLVFYVGLFFHVYTRESYALFAKKF